MLNLYVRKDLNMRKGKMAAQSGHAGMKLFLNAMELKSNILVLNKKKKEQLIQFLAQPDINVNMVKDENELDKCVDNTQQCALIVDHGKTEFHGVLTKTCACSGLFSDKSTTPEYEPKDYESGIKAKQVIVFSKELPLTKEDSCYLALLGCISMLKEQCTETISGELNINLAKKNDLSLWLSGAFAKISLSVKTNEELFVLHNQLKENGIKSLIIEKEENKALIIEPLQPEKIDPFTRNLSLI